MGKNELMLVAFVLAAWADDVDAARVNVRNAYGDLLLYSRARDLRRWSIAVRQEFEGGTSFSPSQGELEGLRSFCFERGEALCNCNVPFIDLSKENGLDIPPRDPSGEASCLCVWVCWNQERLSNHEC